MVSKSFATGLVSLLLLGATSIPAMAHSQESGRDDVRLGLGIGFGARAHTEETKTPPTAEQLACAAAAVDKREAAIGVVVDAHSAAVRTALSTRRTALAAAWKLTDATARRDAIKATWKAHNTAVREANKKLRTDRLAAWQQFRTEVKACKVSTDEPNSDL